MSFIPPNAPPSTFPPPDTVNDGKVGGTATPAPAPPETFPPPTSTDTRVITAPVAPPAPPANYQDGYTTQDQINTLFKIVSPRPGSGS